MMTVCIVGAGDLGGAIAQALAEHDRVGHVLLVDSAGAVAAGKALDLRQACAIDGYHTRLEGTTDLTRAAGCGVYVLADRHGAPASEWCDDEGLALLRRLAPLAGAAPLVFAGATQTALMQTAARELGLRRERLIGSAAEALASAVRGVVAMEARCSPGEVMLTVLGTPPAGFVVPWSEASIGGYALDRVLSQVQLTRLEARAARLWPPGQFALGMAAATVVAAVVDASRRAFSVLTVLDGEFGIRGRVAALPSLLATPGIVHRRVPTLNARERIRLDIVLDGVTASNG
jgi:malate/lactate dehydrogenase